MSRLFGDRTKSFVSSWSLGLFWCSVIFNCCFASPLFAFYDEALSYVKNSQVGFDYSNLIDRVDLSYDIDSYDRIEPSCILNPDGKSKRCIVKMIGGISNGWGVFLQPPFKRQGLFYFDWDVSLGARYLSGRLRNEQGELDGLPLRDARFNLLAAVIRPYIQFGVTPDGLPDLLVSLGPALQIALGPMEVNGNSEFVAVGTSSVSGPLSLMNGFFALEMVLYRFGDGAFSLIASRDMTGHGRGSPVYPGGLDGMTGFRANFRRDVGGMAFGFGLKLVTPWP